MAPRKKEKVSAVFPFSFRSIEVHRWRLRNAIEHTNDKPSVTCHRRNSDKANEGVSYVPLGTSAKTPLRRLPFPFLFAILANVLAFAILVTVFASHDLIAIPTLPW
jgi:hypothetical protein